MSSEAEAICSSRQAPRGMEDIATVGGRAKGSQVQPGNRPLTCGGLQVA